MAILVASGACNRCSDRERAPRSAAAIEIHGAGATLPYPLYSRWSAEYQKVDPRVWINYQSIGSGGGIRQIIERTVDFGASDVPMTDEELAKAPGKLIHLPVTLGAVVVAYNLPGAPKLTLSSELVAGIFLGQIKTWNDPRIAVVNPSVALPARPITIVYRSDGSGTTAVFTDYLSRVSTAWRTRVGAGKSVRFPVGLGAKGNEGVAGQMKAAPGTIGYVELAYARHAGLAYAAIRNRAGTPVEPTLSAIAAAVAAVARMPDDLRVSIVDAPGEAAYPLSSFSYVLVYEEQADRVKGEALVQFLLWAIHEGQSFGPSLDYAPLPTAVVDRVEEKLRAVTSGGRPLLAET